MKIETKFNVKDAVFCAQCRYDGPGEWLRSVVKAGIRTVYTETDEEEPNGVVIDYEVMCEDGTYDLFPERAVFATREEAEAFAAEQKSKGNVVLRLAPADDEVEE